MTTVDDAVYRLSGRLVGRQAEQDAGFGGGFGPVAGFEGAGLHHVDAQAAEDGPAGDGYRALGHAVRAGQGLRAECEGGGGGGEPANHVDLALDGEVPRVQRRARRRSGRQHRKVACDVLTGRHARGIDVHPAAAEAS